jgi:PhnB protein
MSRVNVYLNFPGNTEEAFNFYKDVFGKEFEGGIMRFSDMPQSENTPPVPDDTKNLVMHVCLNIYDDFRLMGSDAPQSMGYNVNIGNNVYISIDPKSRQEAHKLFDALSAGGIIEQELQDMFWGDYFGSLRDKFGVQWMIVCSAKQ